MNKDQYINELETVLTGAVACLQAIKTSPDVNLSKVRGMAPDAVETVIMAAAVTMAGKPTRKEKSDAGREVSPVPADKEPQA